MKKSKDQHGGAVVIAILVVALITTVASSLIRRQSLWVAQTETALALSQGRQLLLTGIDWSLTVLVDDARSGPVDHLQEVWNSRPAPIKTDEWEITGYIEDQQSRFNLNNLVQNGKVSAADIALFINLLQQTGLPGQLAQSLVDWMDQDHEITPPGGAEDSEYLQFSPPRRAANQPLTDLSELFRIKGFDAQTIERLRANVTVLPVPTAINANTASPVVLSATIPGLTLSEAQVLADSRANSPFQSLADLQSRLPRSELGFDAQKLSVGSQYFLVTGTASKGNIKMGMTALVNREGTTRPAIIWRRES